MTTNATKIAVIAPPSAMRPERLARRGQPVTNAAVAGRRGSPIEPLGQDPIQDHGTDRRATANGQHRDPGPGDDPTEPDRQGGERRNRPGLRQHGSSEQCREG